MRQICYVAVCDFSHWSLTAASTDYLRKGCVHHRKYFKRSKDV